MMQCDMDHLPFFGILGQVNQLCLLRARQLFSAYDLKPWQASILFAINCEGELSQRELAEKLRITAPSITAAIQKMERQGYIQRKADVKDQRVMRLSLTDKSRACLDQIKEAALQIEEIAFRGMDSEERKLMMQMFDHMRKNLQEGVDYEKII